MISTYRVVSLAYELFPVAGALAAGMAVRRNGSVAPVRVYLRIGALGTTLGIAVVLLYGVILGKTISAYEAAVTCWFLTSALCIVQAFNLGLDWVLGRLIRRLTQHGAEVCCPGASIATAVLRAAVVLVVGASLLTGVSLSYRPRTRSDGDPGTILHVPFQAVQFPATDGLRLSGWWIPAPNPVESPDRAAPDWGQATVILCPGFADDKSSDLPTVRDLIPNGFNVLAIDLRGQGASSGRFSTYGDLERRDVMGAVRWLKQHHPQESCRILGLGINTGAAALIGAATDPAVEGQSIDAVAAFEPFTDLRSLIGNTVDERILPAPSWFLNEVAVPLAGAQLGADLKHWSPSRAVQSLWPRPLLVIGAENDSICSLSGARDFYAMAQEPKFAYWAGKMPRRKLLFQDRKASLALPIFFRSARPMI